MAKNKKTPIIVFAPKLDWVETTDGINSFWTAWYQGDKYIIFKDADEKFVNAGQKYETLEYAQAVSELIAFNVNVHRSVKIGKDTGFLYPTNIWFKKGVKIGNSNTICSNVTIGENTIIGDCVTIGNNVTIGDNVIISSGVYIESGTKIGNRTIIRSDANIRSNVIIDFQVVIDSSVVIGDEVVISNDSTVGYESKIENNVRISSSVKIGERVHIGEATVVSFECEIGSYCRIGSHTQLRSGVNLIRCIKIGNNTIVGNNVVIGTDCGIGDEVSIGMDVKIGKYTNVNSFCNIGDNCKIGVGCTLFSNVRMEQWSEIGDFVESYDSIEDTIVIRFSSLKGTTLTILNGKVFYLTTDSILEYNRKIGLNTESPQYCEEMLVTEVTNYINENYSNCLSDFWRDKETKNMVSTIKKMIPDIPSHQV